MPPIIRIGGILSTERGFRSEGSNILHVLVFLDFLKLDVHVQTQVVQGRQCEDKNT